MDVLADKQRRSRLEITRRVRSISSLCIFYVTGDLEAKDRPGTAKALAYVWDTRLDFILVARAWQSVLFKADSVGTF